MSQERRKHVRAPSKLQAVRTSIPSGQHYRLLADDRPLEFREYLSRLANDALFRGWYTDLLNASEMEAYFWEHPPVDRTTLNQEVEFVLIDAPAMRGLCADASSFSQQLDRAAFESAVSFSNLGGDALLVAPGYGPATTNCAHLGAFLRTASESQVRALWHTIGHSVNQRISGAPLWLSTSGLGVSWLHVRLDSAPKYYQYRPYRLPSKQCALETR